MNIQTYKFKNGATLLFRRLKHNKGVWFQMFYNIGAANSEYKPGLLHFGEHLRAMKTKDMPKTECDKFVTYNAITYNAFTSLDTLSFYGYSSIKKIKETFHIVTEKMINNEVTEEEFENERKVILNEIDRAKDSDERNNSKAVMQTIYKNPFYHCNVIGEHEDIKSYTQQQVQEHINKVINTHNLTICIVGDIKPSKAKRLVKKYVFKKIPSTKPEIFAMDDTYEFYENSRINIVTNTNVSTQVTISFPFKLEGKNYGLKESYMIYKYINNMFNNWSGIVYQKLRVENGLIYGGEARANIYKGKGTYDISYKCNKSNINKSLEILANALKEIKITKQQFKEIKKLNKLRQDKNFRPTYGERVRSMFETYRIHNKFFKGKYTDKLYNKITYKEVNKIIDRIFKNNIVFVTTYGNAKQEDIYTIEEIEKLFFEK